MTFETPFKPERPPKRSATYRGLAILLTIPLYASAPIVAPIILGPRGDFLALTLQWFVALFISGAVAFLLFAVFMGATSGWKWAALAGLFLFGGIFVFASIQELMTTADLV